MSRRISIATLTVILFVLGHLVFVLSKWHAVPLDHGMPTGQTDPDTWLRLTLVRDWLLSGDWSDHLVHRSNAPFVPVPSPWTRPLDLIIAALVKLQPAGIDLSLRLIRAGLLLPVLWMGLLLLGIHRAIRRLVPLPAAFVMASIMLITLQPMWNYYTLGNADHHAPLAALFVFVVGSLLTPHPSRRLMFITGLAFGLQLWISVEALVLIALVYGWLGLGWLRGDRQKIFALGWLSLGAALMACFAVLVERPHAAWLVPVADSISIMQATALILCAMLAWMLRFDPARNFYERLITAALGIALLLLGIVSSYPQLFAGPMAGVDSYILTDFLPRISEAKPFYRVSFWQLDATLITPIVGLVFCRKKKNKRFYAREQAALLAFLLFAMLVLYACEQRWNYYLLPLSIIAVAPVLGALFTPEHALVSSRWPARTLLGLSEKEQVKRRLPATLALLALPFLLMLADDFSNLTRPVNAPMNEADTRAQARNSCYDAARQLIRSGELLRVLGQQPLTLFIATDLGTEVLFFTPYRIVASNYHREGKGIKYIWESDAITEAGALRTHLRERHIDALLLCPAVEQPEHSLLQAYAAGANAPAWLKPVHYTVPPPPPGTKPEKEKLKSFPALLKFLDKKSNVVLNKS